METWIVNGAKVQNSPLMNHSFNATHFTFYERKNWCSVWLATILVSTDLSSCSIVFTFVSIVSILQVHCVPHFCFVIDTDTSSISCLSQITVLYYASRRPSWFPTVADNRWPFFFFPQDPIQDFTIPLKPLTGWFTEEKVTAKRKEIKELVMRLKETQEKGKSWHPHRA